MSKKYFLLFVLIPLVGAGCGSSGTNPALATDTAQTGATAGKAACDLFSSDIAATELGGTPTPQTLNSEETGGDTTVSTCGWSANGAASTLLVRTSPSNDEAAKAFMDIKSQVSSMFHTTPEDVSGMGDSAYWIGSPLNQLKVLKGNQWLILSLLKGTSGTDRTAVTAAMQAVLKKM